MKICYPVFSLGENAGELGDNNSGTEIFKRSHMPIEIAMREDILCKSENIVILDNPQEVDIIDWWVAHLNCDALFLDGSDYSKMIIVAYALNENGNNELLKIQKKYTSLKLCRGMDESMTNRI